MVGGSVSAFFGGLHFWWPKVTGRLYNEAWARFAAIILYIGFNLTFFPQFIAGYAGMRRRIHVYDVQYQVENVISSTGALLLAIAYILPLFYLTWSLFNGRRAGANPWDATGLEWTTGSPPPRRNFLQPPHVDEDPYAYHDKSRSPDKTDSPARAGREEDT
jgi:cytochrome c oxidase subunit 1